MRRAYTGPELLIVILIIAVIVLIFVPDQDSSKIIKRGDEVQVKETSARGRVLEHDSLTVKLRFDNGPGAVPRYSEVSFFRDEVTKLAEKKP